MATNIKIVERVVTELPEERPLVPGEKYKVLQPNGDLLNYTINSEGNPVFIRGVSNEQNIRLERLNNEQVTKLEGLMTQQELDQRLNTITAGERGSIGPQDQAPEEDGIWRAKESGVYDNLGGLVVEEGKSVWFLKDGNIWTIYAEIDSAPATGVVQQNNTGATSGDTVYRYVAPIKDSLDTIAVRKNQFNKVNLLNNVNIETLSDPTKVRMIPQTGSVTAWAILELGKTYVIQGVPINTAGHRSGFFNTLSTLVEGERNNGEVFTVPAGYTYFCFGVKYQDNPSLDLDAIQIEEGTTPTEVVPYEFVKIDFTDQINGQVVSGDDDPVAGGVVYDAVNPMKEDLYNVVKGKSLFNPVNILEGFTLDVNGDNARIMEQEGSTLGFARIETGKSYYLQLDNKFNTVGHRVAFMPSLNSTLGYRIDARVSNNPFSTNNPEWQYIVFGLVYEPTGSAVDLSKVQLEEGTAPSPIVPFEDFTVMKEGDKGCFITGASFTFSGNPWFAMGTKSLRGSHFNRAVSDENITHTAFKMFEGTLYTPEEMDQFQYFCIMHTHNYVIDDTTGIQEDYHDYEPIVVNGLTRSQAWDYVLKKYKDDCYQLKDDPASRYYGSTFGKPCNIVVMTDWHDARTIFNQSVRRLRDKWGFNLLEFDTQIGFSKNQVNPSTGEQPSILYAVDTQVINGVTYGWHPARTVDNPAQQRMASLFNDFITKL